jgi:hypothetical protein
MITVRSSRASDAASQTSEHVVKAAWLDSRHLCPVKTPGAVLLLLASVVIASGASVSAHRRDEFLQAARIGIEPGRVRIEMSLTPGIAVADAVIAEIDANRDGLLAPDEQQAYAARVLRSIDLRVDAAPLALTLAESSFPAGAAMHTGDVAITLQLEADVPSLAPGAHRIVFRNGHAVSSSVYLANALVPASERVAITHQRRDVDQTELGIDYTLRDEEAPSRAWLLFGLAGTLAVVTARRVWS